MHSYTLQELNAYIRRVIALNFDEAIWIECEISNISHNRGNVYLDLVEKAEGSDEIIAQTAAVIWYKANLFVKNKLKDLYDSILDIGINIKCKVVVDYHERYGLKLVIEDIDPAFTMGNMEIERQQTIESLKRRGLLDKNKQIPLPSVIQKVAVISSATAAGYKDFVAQLTQNAYGYKYDISLFKSAMQGINTAPEVVKALGDIQKFYTTYDCVVIIRGGGSKIDLSYFDQKQICEAIAEYVIPVLTGIGHEIDLSVADMVAHTYLKTPTAVANFLIDHNLYYESSLIELQNQLSRQTKHLFDYTKESLYNLQQLLDYSCQKRLLTNDQKLDNLKQTLMFRLSELVRTKSNKLDQHTSVLTSLQPKNVLKMGYTIARQDGKLLARAKEVDINKEISLEFYDDTVSLQQ